MAIPRDAQLVPPGVLIVALCAELLRKTEADRLHYLEHDGLTGLPNRSLLSRRVQQAIGSAGSGELQPALLLLDLKHFNGVNETLGRHVGDHLLRLLAQRLQGAVRPSDLVARLGGDEFAILLPEINTDGATDAAETLVRLLQTPFTIDQQSVIIDANVGVALASTGGQDTDTLLRQADVAMYQAKHANTGVAVYSRADDQHRPDQLALGADLRQAIQRKELLLHYQPKLDLRDGTLVGVEALVRWQHPTRGFLPPGEFIPLAEQSGLIHPISVWVLDAALRQQRAWQSNGLDIPVAVNLSRHTLHEPGLADTVAELLTRWGVPGSALVLEITESSLMADPRRAGDNLKQLSALGVCTSIDDFGTGYSSLASLKDPLVDEVKIDRSFVQGMATDASARAIVRAIIDMADALQLRVVAEGVEDRATWDVLAGLGCDVAQGYLVSAALPADELADWVARVAPTWVEIAGRPKTRDPLTERIRGRGARLTAEEEFLARKQSEAALLASEERNRLALRAARMGTWDLDTVHDVLTCSPQTEVLHGLAPGTLGRTFAAFQRTVHPDDRPAFARDMHASNAEHEQTTAKYRTVWPDSSVHWIESDRRGSFSADGTLRRVSGTSIDITERELAGAALRASEARFRAQYKGFPLPTYSWLQAGNDFVLQDYNDAAEAIAESNPQEWIGIRASVRYAPQPLILADLQACVEQQGIIRRELRFRQSDAGSERDSALTYVFVPPRTVMLHNEDITERKLAEQQRHSMAQSERMRALGQMASGIAHDLNQSLMLVASYSDLARQALIEDPPDWAGADDLLATSTRAALDGGETVKRLLQFTRAVPDRDGKPVDLETVVREAARLTAPRWRDAAQAEGRPISLLIEVESHPTIQGSPGQFRELMTNIIFNAVDALPNGGTIRLRVATDHDQGIVEVIDSGIGMSAEVQQHVFEPFYTTKGERGTGLGLALVFGIVEQHRGHIFVHSALGEGTTFRMTFPLVYPVLTPVAPAIAVPHPQLLVPLRVLVVDDEPLMTRAVARMLKPSGHRVHIAGTGEEALELLADQTFDVVVSDMGMGDGMNGWELAQAVKGRWPAVRFLLATGWGAAIDPEEAVSRGVDGVLSKPYQHVELLQKLAA